MRPPSSSVTPVEDGRPASRARLAKPVARGAAGDGASAPRSSASATCSSIFAAVRCVVERPHRGRVVERVAEPDPSRDRRDEPLDELVVHRVGATSSRSPAVQLWPAHRKQAVRRRPRPPRSRSASSRTTSGPLPPISSSSRLAGRRARAIRAPVAVEPMKPTASAPRIGARSRRRPSSPGPVTRLKTPGGRSASTMQLGERDGRHGRGRRRRSRRRCCRRRAPARSARRASCTASSTA